VAGSEHLTVDDRLYNWLAAAEAVTEWGLDWFGIGHKGPMRSGCDRAADMMLIRTGRGGSSASTTQIVHGGRASRVSGVRLERGIVLIGGENVARSTAWCHRSGRSCVRFVPLR